MKRWLSLLLTVALLMSLCMPMIHATPIEELCYAKPTNARWGDDGTMLWESDYFTNFPDNFQGFQIAIRYTTDDVGSVASPEWETMFTYQTYLQYPSMGDFTLPVSGWYSFQVRAYGENVPGENEWAYEYISEMSDWSEAKYFETADRLPMPTDLHWEGPTMCWTVQDTTYVRGCQVQVCYLKNGQEEPATSRWVTPQYRQTDFALSLEEMGLDEGWLVENGTQSYYFKVMSVTNDTTKAADSAWAVCNERMDFNSSAAKMETPSNLYWDNYTMKWDAVEGVSYDVKLWFQRTELTPEEEAELGAAGGSSSEIFTAWEIKEYSGITGDDDWPVLDNSVLHDQKGNYWFQVRARSTDLSKNLSSDWSAESYELSVDGRFQLNTPIWITWNSDDTLSWTWEAPAAQQAVLDGFYVQVYYKADLSDEAEYVGGVSISGNTTSTTKWKNYANKDGYYSARVYAETNDYDAFENSEMSDLGTDWWYNAPDPLASPTGLTWVGSKATWTPVGDASGVNRYMVSLYYCGIDGNSEPVSYVSWSANKDDPQVLFTEDNFTRSGEGVYKFGVIATTADPDQASDSLEVMSAPFTYTIPSTSLAAPTGMYWEKNYMKWEIPADTTGIGGYEVNYFGDSHPYGYNTTVKVGEFPVLGDWNLDNLGDNIGFKVRALSDNVSENKNSPWSTCATSYVPPEGLPVPTNIAWNGSTMTWSWEGDESMLSHFIVDVYYAANEDAEPVYCGTVGTDEKELPIYGWIDKATEGGLYFFTVQAFSLNNSVIPHSKDSEMSASYQVTPADPLPAPAGMKWDGSEIVWTIPGEEILEYIDYYEIHLYKPEDQANKISSAPVEPYLGRYHVPTEVFESYGTGTYTFSIRAVSRDISQYSNTGFLSSGSNFVFAGFKSDLPAPQNLRWEGNTAKWDAPEYGTVNSYELKVTGSLRSIDYTVAAGSSITLSTYEVNRMGDNITFQVRALSGNVNEYGDGSWAFCQTPLEFEIEKMAVPTDLAWNDGTMTWKWSAANDLQANLRDVFSVEIYYSATADAEPQLLGARGVWGSGYTAWTQLAQDDGWYYFRVNTCSYNNNLVLSSDWSEMSDGYYYEVPEPVLPATNVHWDSSAVVWTASESGYNVARQYRVELYYIGNDGTETKVATRYETNSQDLTTLRHTIPTSLFSKNGNGSYKVAVIAQASDPLANSNSVPAWSGEYTYTNPGKVLDAPTNLRWENGIAKWDIPADTAAIGCYEVIFFNANNPDDGYSQDLAPGQFAAVDSWYLMMLGEEIGFEVRAISNDANTASDSVWATCATNFVYDPDNVSPLPAPTNLKYDSKSDQLTWDVVENADEYIVKVWLTVKGWEEEDRYGTYYIDGQDANVYFYPDVEGTYRFEVKATSSSVIYSESESVEVEYLYQLKPVEDVSKELASAIANSSTASEAVTAIKEMDIKDLANAMTAPADEESNSVVAQIKALEAELNVGSEVSVGDAVENLFSKDTVEVVGAALSADSGTVTLSIQEKSEDMPQVSEESYVNTVSFSMHLEDKDGTAIGELDVPVWIKLPVPSGMNPSLLWILHYRDGSDEPEIIVPTMTEESGQWYASFAVTGFSDFAMTNRKPQVFLSESNGVWTATPDPYYEPKQGGLCIWAVYDENGRMIAAVTGTGEIPFNCDGKPASAKLFIVDSESQQPTCLETPCVLEVRELQD